jgi:biofilm PGA synthesis N-glycosyltransferase PgaC
MWLILLSVVSLLQVACLGLLAFAWKKGKKPPRNANEGPSIPPKNEETQTFNSQLSTLHPSPDSYREPTLHSPLSTLHSQNPQKSTPNPNGESISIILAAKNEAENLRRFLPGILNQSYTCNFEVVLVLDRCTDDSAVVASEYQSRYPRLRTIAIDDLPMGWTGKKHALNMAIQAARYDCLAFTDADCELPPTWLSGMATEFSKGSDLILGVSPYAPARGFLNLLIRFETWMTAILYVGLAFFRLPYMGVGRSLGYRKSWFEAAGGFTDIAHRLSGDDDLLVNRAADPAKTGLLTALETQVVSLPKTTWRAWMQQKIRHGSAGTAYKPASILILSAFHGLHLIFYLSLIVVLCAQPAYGWALMIYLLRTAAMTLILATLPWRNKAALLVAFPLLDAAYLIYIALLAPAAAFIRPKWN